jgi:O-antigen/teichoic acid export membrane protein
VLGLGQAKRPVALAAKGGFAVLDQGLISGSNFVMGILLARWLVPGEYGAYSLAFSVFLLLSIVYQALLLEPMMVFGGAAEVDSLRGYLKVLTRIHWMVVCVMFGALALSAGVAQHSLSQAGLSHHGLPMALVGAAMAGPCVLLFWLYRRALYLDISIAKAAFGALFYGVVLIAASFGLEWFGLLSAFSAFLAMAGAALITSAVLYRQLQALVPAGGAVPSAKETWRKHWRYGRWAVASAVAGWVPAYIYYPLLGGFGGMTQAADLRALMNLAQPMAQFYAALSAVFLPYAAKQRVQDPEGGLAEIARAGTLVFMLAALSYWAIVAVLRGQVFHLLYGQKYANVTGLIPIIAIGSVLWSGTIGASIALRAMESPDTIFLAYGAASVVSILAGVPLSRMAGVAGAAWAMNLSDAVALVMILLLLVQRVRRETALYEEKE